MAERTGIFEEEEVKTPTPIDLSDFQPASVEQAGPPLDQVRSISEATHFRSREPLPQKKPRLHRTGRNVQFNVKLRAEDISLFTRLADAKGWTMGETLEEAAQALKEKLKL